LVRPCDIDTSTETWKYVPAEHKTEHYGKQRTILIGPRAQDVLRCFCPVESERKRLALRHEARRTPLGYGNRPDTNRIRRKSKRMAGARYDTASYRRSIDRACNRAFPPPTDATPEQARQWRRSHRWAPNRLRHTAATALRKRFGNVNIRFADFGVVFGKMNRGGVI
jgi:hypothetical protein